MEGYETIIKLKHITETSKDFIKDIFSDYDEDMQIVNTECNTKKINISKEEYDKQLGE